MWSAFQSENDEVAVWAITLGGEAIYRTGVTTATPAVSTSMHILLLV